MNLKNKFAIVTGASTGIGRAVAVEFAKNGITVALVARRKDKLEETKKLVERVEGKAEIFEADLGNVESINKLIQLIRRFANKVDILVNVAGVWHGKDEVYAGIDFEKFPQKVILDTYSVGLIAPTLLSHGLVDLMPEGSNIINISGTFSSGAKGWLPYYVSKRGIEDLTIALSQEFEDKKINVNCISPSDVATEEYIKYFPKDAKTALSPDEIAKYVIKLCSSNETGKVVVLKNNQEPDKEGFHK